MAKDPNDRTTKDFVAAAPVLGLIDQPVSVPRRRVIHPTGGKKMTEDHHAVDVSLKTIMRRHGLVDVHPALLTPNFSNVTFGDAIRPSFQELQNVVVSMHEAFMRYPAAIRSKFRNDPSAFLEFVQDPQNRQAMLDMGLSDAHLPPKPAEKEAAPQPPDPAGKQA